MKITKIDSKKVELKSDASLALTSKLKPVKPINNLSLKEDGPFIVTLRNLIGKGLTSKARIYACQEEKAILSEKLEELKTFDFDLKEETLDLNRRFSSLGLSLEKLLIKNFKTADSTGRRIILNMLTVLGNGSSGFIKWILERGKSDFRFNDCMNFLKEQDVEQFKKFIEGLKFDSEEKTRKFARSLAQIKDESDLVEILGSEISRVAIVEDTSLKDLEDRQFLLTHVIDSFGKKEHELYYRKISDVFNSAVSWDVLNATQKVLLKISKDKFFAEVKTSVESADEYSDSIQFNRLFYLYVKDSLNKEKAKEIIKNILDNSSVPMNVLTACNLSVTYLGEEGKKILEEIIEMDISTIKPSVVLANVIIDSRKTKVYDDFMERIFSKHKCIIENLKLISKEKIPIAGNYDKYGSYEEIKAVFPRMLSAIGVEKLVNWICFSENVTLMNNAKEIFLAGLNPKTNKNDKFRESVISILRSNTRESRLLRELANSYVS